MISVHLGSGIDRRTAGAVVAQIHKDDLVKAASVTADEVVHNLVLDPPTMQLVSLICSMISLLVTLKRELVQGIEKRKLTAERFETVLKDELLKFGLVNFKVVNVRDFSELEKSGSCRIEVVNNETGESQVFALRSSHFGYELSKAAG